VLVVDARTLGGDVPSATEAMDSRIGAPEPTALEAGSSCSGSGCT